MNALPLWAEIVIAALLVTGAAFALVGSWGLAKFSDILKRLHGPSKATTLGVGCVLIASALYFALQGEPSLHELLIALFLFITAPVSAHLIVKAAMRLDPALRPPAPGERR
ncbi:MAG: Na+/H+ antiporter subunit G [Rubrivivax sp.]|nr:Na+/H+ antiporter subunit G [Rubrivivax sp.]